MAFGLNSMVKRLIKYIVQRIKWYGIVSSPFSTHISMRSHFEGMNKLYSNIIFDGSMGIGTYIAGGSKISGRIGRYTSIAQNCKVIQGVHPYTYPYVSTSPMFISLLKQNGYTFVKEQKMIEIKYANGNYPICIGNDCWIGADVSIIGGVSIGDGVVVLAGAVVTKDIPPYAIVGGIPAKILRYRYSKEDIDFLLKFQWWNKDVEWLKDNANLFLDIKKLKQVYE